ASFTQSMDQGLGITREYLVRYSDYELIRYFNKKQQQQAGESAPEVEEHKLSSLSLMTLMPAYAISEIQSAFKIAFYLYDTFVVIDLVVSSIFLALGLMMISPATILVPIKLMLFVAMNGWTLLT
ncbi:EscR/YscR/HrcR family type III secretion system export apparatus protein, partial [Erwinia amylovora]